MDFLRVMLTIFLISVMCLGTAIPAFATGVLFKGTEDKPAYAVITKRLKMPEGTKTPEVTFTFTFTFTKKSVDGTELASDSNAMPAIKPAAVTFTAKNIGNTASGVKTVGKQVISGAAFPHAGVYVYEVTENQNVTGYTPGYNETFNFSSAKYDVTFYVKNGENGPYTAAVDQKIVVNDIENVTSSVNTKVYSIPTGW